jgi:hypothetical protein
MASSPRPPIRYKPWLLIIVLLGAALRFVPIWFGLPFDRARPDEETAIGHAVAVLGGDPNPHFFDWPSLTFYLFAAAFAVASWIHRLLALDPALTVNEQYLIARGVVALAGTLTIVVLVDLARSVADETTALVASFFLAVATLHVRESHFAMTDVLMTLFTTTSLALLVRPLTTLVDSGSVQAIGIASFVSAGFAGGLAASTKYSGAAILAAFAASAYIWTREANRMPSRLQIWTPAVALVVSFACGFVAATPFALLDYRSFSSGLAFDVTHLSTGHAGPDLGRGWSYHLKRSLPTALGLPVSLAAIPGAIRMATTHARAALITGAFCAALYTLLAPGRTVFFRYILPIGPLACLCAAVAVRHAADWLAPRARLPRHALAVALAIAISVPTLVNSVWMDVLLAKTDTRVLAGKWLAARVKPEESLYDAGGAYAGASLVGLSVHRWTVETFDPTRNAFTNSSGRLPDWLVLPESPLVYGTVPTDLRRLAAEKYELAQTIPATRLHNDATVYDLQDAFFLPMSGFGTVIRPGPTIRIFRRLQSPR